MATVASTLTSALVLKVAAAAVAAAAASSHSSARRRFKATGISGTQHAVSVAALAAGAALAALAANDHSADSDRSVTGVGDANTTKGASSDAKKDKRRGRTKKPALIWTESANEDADENTTIVAVSGGGSGTLPGLRRSPRCGRW
ncbi:hypothetical protein BASA81_008987 [Batrachochytrium salamandrivorans]|nr:hypothetical protein BASA81_008987 [Batrachochytrium salamandrivorans]